MRDYSTFVSQSKGNLGLAYLLKQHILRKYRSQEFLEWAIALSEFLQRLITTEIIYGLVCKKVLFLSYSCWSFVVAMLTVEMGRRYFPHCSEVLDKFMEDDLPDLFYLEKGSQDEQRIKRRRFMELKDDVQKAFNKDKAEFNRSRMSSSSSSTSLKYGVNYKVQK